MDLSKTQFLIEDRGTHTSIRIFKRKRIGMLFDKRGPVRPISWSGYQKLVKDWPKETKDDGVRYETVWSLIPHTATLEVEEETFSTKILWGEFPEPGSEPETYTFNTQAELDAFMKGIEAMDGWMGYEVINDETSDRTHGDACPCDRV